MASPLEAELLRRATSPGNINLFSRPIVKNPDGSTSTVRSMSFGDEDGKETLIPTVQREGNGILSDDDAISQYRRTGEYLGKFNSVPEADQYAARLHEQMAAGDYTPPLASSRQDVDPNQLSHVLRVLLARGR